ncbi:MAG: hypothetical protein ACXVCY_10200 [Pseudobdellovibrionaceae bacterium]
MVFWIFAAHQSVAARSKSAAVFYNRLEDSNYTLPQTKKLLPNTAFHYETESHRLRIPRYIAYLLQSEDFLKKFPEYKGLYSEFANVIVAANGHDIEKRPKHIYTKLAHDRGINYDKLPFDEAQKAKAFRAAFNADGEEKTINLLKSIGFADEFGNVNAKGKLFYTLEAFVDRWDAYRFRAEEFGKKMLRPGDYIRQVLKPSGFQAEHYNLDRVAEMDDFVNAEENKVNMEKAVGRFTPQNYKKIRNRFRGGSPAFEDIQQEQANKLIADHIDKSSDVIKNSELESDTCVLCRRRFVGFNRVGDVLIIGAAASALHDTLDPKKNIGEALNSAASSSWTIATAGLGQIRSLADDMADRYKDPKVYEEYLDLPLEDQETIFRDNNTLPFRTVIFSKRPQITQVQCGIEKATLDNQQSHSIEIDVLSPERKNLHMKIFFENNEPLYFIGKPILPSGMDDTAIRLSLQSEQACFSLPQYSNEIHAFVFQKKCTTVNSKGLPDLEPELSQHLNPDYWDEMVKTHNWLLGHFKQLKSCCNKSECLQLMNRNKSPLGGTNIEKNAKAKEMQGTSQKGQR